MTGQHTLDGDWRLSWQDWSSHIPGQPAPKPEFADFKDREKAEAAKRELRRRLPGVTACITPAPAPKARKSRKRAA